MIDKDSNLHKELLNVFDGDPVKITISTLERTNTMSGEGVITLVYKKTENIIEDFELIILGNMPVYGAIRAMEEIKKALINGGTDGR